MTDRCRPLKLESVAEGGSSDDSLSGPTEMDPGQDYVDCAGVTLQKLGANRNTADAAVRMERTAAGAMHLTDTVANGAAGLDLSQLLNTVTGSANAFNALADIRLWVTGPGDGFPSGAVKVRLGTAPNAAGYVWYRSAALTSRLFDCAFSYAQGSILPATKVYRLYAADGATVLRTITDTLIWNGPILSQTTRSWS